MIHPMGWVSLSAVISGIGAEIPLNVRPVGTEPVHPIAYEVCDHYDTLFRGFIVY